MGKKVRSGAIIVVVLAIFGTFYHSSLASIVNTGQEWLRRQRTDFCHPGYQLHSEYCLTSDIGQRLNVYVFESSFTVQDAATGRKHRLVQIMLEDEDHSELHRISLNASHCLLSTTAFPSVNQRRLELAFQMHESEGGIRCTFWRVARGKIVPVDPNIRIPSENVERFLPNACPI